ncbi:MAG: GIY-YIG nuclease family protein [Actinobacteria bacterium]|nr:GIY-YIG nuclease family protein [Actinomycetota bacterium]
MEDVMRSHDGPVMTGKRPRGEVSRRPAGPTESEAISCRGMLMAGNGITDGVPESGVYVLVARLSRAMTIRVGSLGEKSLRKGRYAYVGRAKKGLRARLARHVRKEGKRLRWHIDHLLEAAVLEEIWILPLETGECETASGMAARGGDRDGLRGFGSGDCRCPGHLLYLGWKRPVPPADVLLSVRVPGGGVRPREIGG